MPPVVGTVGQTFPTSWNYGQVVTPAHLADTGATVARLWSMAKNGDYSLAGLVLDGVGNQAVALPSGVFLYLDGGAFKVGNSSGTVPDIDHSALSGATWHPEGQGTMQLAGNTVKWRRYRAGTTGGVAAVIETINARWDEGTAKWIADIGTVDARAEMLSESGHTIYYKLGAVDWTAWDASATSLAYVPTAGGSGLRFSCPTRVVTARSRTTAATVPGPTVSPGEDCLENRPLGWAKIRFNGVWDLTRHLNVDSYSHPSAGKWELTFRPSVTDSAEVAAFATINTSGDEDYQITAEVISAGAGKITVRVWTAQLSTPGGAGALTKTYTDQNFSVFLFPSTT